MVARAGWSGIWPTESSQPKRGAAGDRAAIEAEVRALAAIIEAGPHLKPDEVRRAIEAIEREAALATYDRPK